MKYASAAKAPPHDDHNATLGGIGRRDRYGRAVGRGGF